MVIWVKKNQTELMVKIYFKTLVRAIGKVLRIQHLARTPIKPLKGDAKMGFVCHQTAFLVVRINNIG